MSYSIRDQAQRKLKQGIGNLDTCLGYLQWFEETYEAQHPELAEMSLQIGALLIAVEEAMQELSRSF